MDTVRSIVEPDARRRLAQRLRLLRRQLRHREGLDQLASRSAATGKKLEIVQGVPVNEFSRAKIDATVNELKEEKSLVGELLPK